jgi:hypothetical protein
VLNFTCHETIRLNEGPDARLATGSVHSCIVRTYNSGLAFWLGKTGYRNTLGCSLQRCLSHGINFLITMLREGTGKFYAENDEAVMHSKYV